MISEQDNSGNTLDFNDDFLLDSVEKRAKEGDFVKALRLLNKRNGMYPPNCDASVLAADIYEQLGLFQKALGAWYHFLDTCNEADFAEGYEGLAVVYMNLGNQEMSSYYYRLMLTSSEEWDAPSSDIDFSFDEKPALRIVEDGEEDKAAFEKGVSLFRTGHLDEAKELLLSVSEESEHYPSAAGLGAMCSLMGGDDEAAAAECERGLEKFPDSVQLLTTYVAVLGEQGREEKQREAALRLTSVVPKDDDERYKIAIVFCEAKLDEEAYHALKILHPETGLDRSILYFYGVAAYRSGRLEEAIEAFDLLTTYYPEAGVAAYYLAQMRKQRDGEREPFELEYVNRLPDAEYRELKTALTSLAKTSDAEAGMYADLTETEELFTIAFDVNDGRDHALQLLASEAALRLRDDVFLREVLLDHRAYETVKLYIVGRLTERNEDNSFGTVLLGVYREYFTRKLILNGAKSKTYLKAYYSVYSRYAILGTANADKIFTAAEDVYYAMASANAYELMGETAAVAAVIYREAHLSDGERDLGKIAEAFDAPLATVKKITALIL